ncbi:two-component system sensor histidine kinase AdeS [Azospirillum lipoferum]|uniref:histidine kinase n=1 Tax=Azospirillum lipoferum TaxID=193 RepID=A0A5A9GLV7_AZOLI|nr:MULTISPECIES: HAMP domain-containing sensor histidine kinase [Azospirillum]KAA0595391.1 HAMP domain-containing histidine kinase [Azospirillum lipoferum]MCP1611709.1 two-component system sensor histidine kinase AdeS [Azospirillum lipoferum]MDW5533532.1 HAMP domain-containing sensor histidine kinase [Azospirillum sp. NL1]
MKPIKPLNRQLVTAMAGVTGLALVLMCAGMFLFYAFIYFRFFGPEGLEDMPEPDSYWPSPAEWVAFLTLWAVGLAGAILAAMRFANQLIQPLDAVATAARRIATGDLGARAAPTRASFAETRQLIEDFNHMAGQLSRAEAEMRAWHAAVAHELRTPLTILRGQLQGYVDGVFIPDTPSLRTLLTQVEGLGRIVDDLKILTLAQNGRLELRLEPIDLAQEVVSVVTAIGPMLQLAEVSVRLDLGAVVVDADGARIRQSLVALLDNVRRHAAPGEVVIETRVTRDHAILRVCDNGPGLPEEAATGIFTPFWRADESRSRRTGGSGLGLAVVKAIAEAHGGGVSVKASDPHGATFEIQLPMQRR